MTQEKTTTLTMSESLKVCEKKWLIWLRKCINHELKRRLDLEN